MDINTVCAGKMIQSIGLRMIAAGLLQAIGIKQDPSTANNP